MTWDKSPIKTLRSWVVISSLFHLFLCVKIDQQIQICLGSIPNSKRRKEWQQPVNAYPTLKPPEPPHYNHPRTYGTCTKISRTSKHQSRNQSRNQSRKKKTNPETHIGTHTRTNTSEPPNPEPTIPEPTLEPPEHLGTSPEPALEAPNLCLGWDP